MLGHLQPDRLIFRLPVGISQSYQNGVCHRELLEENARENQEIREELGLQEHEFTIKLLAYAREIFRGERPQLFCLIRTSLSMKELSFRLQSLRHNAEFDSFEFIEMSDNLIDSLYKVRANYEAAMNCLLLEEFFSES